MGSVGYFRGTLWTGSSQAHGTRSDSANRSTFRSRSILSDEWIALSFFFLLKKNTNIFCFFFCKSIDVGQVGRRPWNRPPTTVIDFYWVIMGSNGFTPYLLGYTWVWLGSRRFISRFIGFYWVWLGLTGFDWVLLGLTGFDWVLRGCTELERLFLVFDWFLLVWLGSKWVSMGSTGFKMGSLGTGGGAPAWGVICILNGQSTAGSVGIKTDTLMG